LGAAHLAASRVVAWDLDEAALAVARGNADRVGQEVTFVHGDVRAFDDRVDTIFMNPPFGGQRKHADRPFLEAALRTGSVVYTFHHAATSAFVEQAIRRLGGEVSERRTYKFPLPHLQPYHREDVAEIEVAHYRIVKGDS
ncbi:MAG: methyltransferase, partial [Thermoplasmata archaeon]|nr:methyltransferase [Thermoplasmata archaeon]